VPETATPIASAPIIRCSDELLTALSAKKSALGLTDEWIEEAAGFAPGHVDAVLSRRRRPNVRTLDKLCDVLTVSLALVNDPDKQRVMKVRWEAHQVGIVDRAREGGKMRWRGVSKEQRSAIARAAVNVRWAKRSASIESAARG
jgi:transcriptional regulator with XRE-family HTH domain